MPSVAEVVAEIVKVLVKVGLPDKGERGLTVIPVDIGGASTTLRATFCVVPLTRNTKTVLAIDLF